MNAHPERPRMCAPWQWDVPLLEDDPEPAPLLYWDHDALIADDGARRVLIVREAAAPAGALPPLAAREPGPVQPPPKPARIVSTPFAHADAQRIAWACHRALLDALV